MKLKFPEAGLIAIFLILVAILGYFFVLDASRTGLAEDVNSQDRHYAFTTRANTQSERSKNAAVRSTSEKLVDSVFGVPNERIVSFESEKAYRDFLDSLNGSQVRLIGSIDRFRSVRIGFDQLSDIDGLLDDEALIGANYSVSLPLLPTDDSIQFGAVGFNGNALDFLGIDSDNSAWGEGLLIAVIDTGVAPHDGLSGDIRHINLSASTSEVQNGHGTAVSSLMVGRDGIAPGVSPGASLLDIRIADESGSSSSFLLAEGILRAADEGADIINISLGSFGDSLLVRRAVEFATEQGIVIVSSSGNEGLAQPTFPAAYPEVVAVGAVDRRGTLVDFSNTGTALDITAPGLQVNAAWLDNRHISFSGTSASSPYVASSIAAVASELGLSPTASRDLILANANESGPAGSDVFYGNGVLDPGRALRSQEPGIFDLAAVSNFVTNDGSDDSLIAIVQNQGTATITNATANVRTGGLDYPLAIPRLVAGEIQAFELPFTPLSGDQSLRIETSTALGDTSLDIEPSNNVRVTTIAPGPDPL